MKKRNNQSTSIHRLNSDHGLNILDKVIWLALNVLNNSFGYQNTDKELAIMPFRVDDLDSNWNMLDLSCSPARTLCDLFWRHLPMRSYETELGGKLRALEVGCGSGAYGRLLNELLDNNVCYHGIDVRRHPDWEALSNCGNYRFSIDNATEVGNYLKDINFLFTQSALEHFDEDLTFFHHISEHVKNGNPLIQVHLMPSESCLTTYFWHGIRQYTPRTISKITRLFPSKTKKTLYRLGSIHCNELHRRWITIPDFMRKYNRRKEFLSQYSDKLRDTIEADMRSPRNATCFYALVLKNIAS